MKVIILSVLCLASASAAFAESVNTDFVQERWIGSLREKDAQIGVYKVDKTILLGANEEKGISVRLVDLYHGESTDVSPTHQLYLTFFHASEENNSRTAFDLGPVWELKSAKRLRAGIYEIQAVVINLDEHSPDYGKMEQRRWEIDTLKVFKDDRNLKPGNFEDPYFRSVIRVREYAVPAKE